MYQFLFSFPASLPAPPLHAPVHCYWHWFQPTRPTTLSGLLRRVSSEGRCHTHWQTTRYTEGSKSNLQTGNCIKNSCVQSSDIARVCICRISWALGGGKLIMRAPSAHAEITICHIYAELHDEAHGFPHPLVAMPLVHSSIWAAAWKTQQAGRWLSWHGHLEPGAERTLLPVLSLLSCPWMCSFVSSLHTSPRHLNSEKAQGPSWQWWALPSIIHMNTNAFTLDTLKMLYSAWAVLYSNGDN